MTTTATVVGSFEFGGGGVVESQRGQWRELLITTTATVVGSFEFSGSGIVKLQRRQRGQWLGLSSLAAAALLNLDKDNGESCY